MDDPLKGNTYMFPALRTKIYVR